MALYFRKNSPPPKNKDLVNEFIYFKKLLVIDELGTKLGVYDKQAALALAQTKALDLVVINAKAEVPIAKIMDYGKFLYEKKRKLKETKKKSSVIKLKSISIKTNISQHDLQWKAQQAIEWLNDGNRVHFSIKAYGRISTKVSLIHETFQRFVVLIGDHGLLQGELKKTSPVLYDAFFNPNKAAKKDKDKGVTNGEN